MRPEIPPYIYILFTAVTSIGVLIQAGVLLGMFLGLRKTQARVELLMKQLNEHVVPAAASTRVALEDLTPKLKVLSSNLVEISETVRSESKNIKGSVDDVLERTRAQTARVDGIVSDTLDGISHAGATIQHGISAPIRQFSGVINGVRAGLGVLCGRAPVSSSKPHIRTEEEEIFSHHMRE